MKYLNLILSALLFCPPIYANSDSERSYLIECFGAIRTSAGHLDRVYKEVKKDYPDAITGDSEILIKSESFQTADVSNLQAVILNDSLENEVKKIKEKLGSAYNNIGFRMYGCRSTNLEHTMQDNTPSKVKMKKDTNVKPPVGTK